MFGKPLGHAQRGSILVVSLLLIGAVGVVAAGTVSILQQNAVTVREDVRLKQGTSVADSLRLARLAGRDESAIKTRLESSMYSGDITAISLSGGGDSYTGSVEFGDKRYGYQFTLNTGDGPAFDDPVNRYTECEDLGGSILCEWGTTTINEPLIFEENTEFAIGKNESVTFNAPVIFEGELELSHSGGQRSFCFKDAVVITGDFKFSSFDAEGKNSTTNCGGNKSLVFQGDVVISDGAKLTPDAPNKAPDAGNDPTSVSGNDGNFDASTASIDDSSGWAFDTGGDQ